MPEPDHAPTRDQRTRRQVLGYASGLVGIGAVTLSSGCRVRLEQEPLRTPPPLTDDELARDHAAAEADELLALIDDARTLRLSADVAVLLGRIASDHEAHLTALRLPQSTTTPSAKPTATSTGASSAQPHVTKASVLTALAERESATGDRVRGALGPLSGDLARLLAGIAASRACHADALTAAESA